MAILTTFKVSGDPDEIVTKMRETIAERAREVGQANGRLSSTIVRTDGGIMVVNVWDNEDGMRRTADEIGPLALDSGIGPQEDWQMYEVLVSD